MKSAKLSATSYLLRLELGDDIHTSVTSFAAQEGMKAATIAGLGAVHNPVLAYYDLATKQYHNRKFDGLYEVVAFTGNLARLDDEPFMHAHVVISDRDMQTFGGHLVSGSTGATLELAVQTVEIALRRQLDDHTGLKLLNW